MRALAVALAILLAPLPAFALGVSGGGGHAIQSSDGSSQPQRGILQCADNLTCEDDAGNNRTKVRALVGPSTLYVSPNGSALNDGLTSLTPKACPNEALALLPGALTQSTEIILASGTFSCPAEDVDLVLYVRSAPLVIKKLILGGTYLTIRGTFNSTANSFTNVPVDSGTASASATNDFPVTGAGAVGTTTFTDATKSWTVNGFALDWLHLTGGTCFNAEEDGKNWYVIDSNTSTVLTLNTTWNCSSVPTTGTTYEIYDRTHNTIVASAGDTTAIILETANVVLKGLRLGVPTGSTGSDNKSIWIWRSRMNFQYGDFGVNSHHSSMVYAVYEGSQSIYGASTHYSMDCAAPGTYCVFENVDIRNFACFAVLSQAGAHVRYKYSYAATGAAGSVGCGALKSNNNGSIQVDRSWLLAPTGGSGVFAQSGQVEFSEKVRVSCSSTAAGNDGATITTGSTLSTIGTVHRADSCNGGIRTGPNATWHMLVTPTYAGNTANAPAHASAVTTATYY